VFQVRIVFQLVCSSLPLNILEIEQLLKHTQLVGSSLATATVRSRVNWNETETVTAFGVVSSEPLSVDSMYLAGGKFLNADLTTLELRGLSVINSCQRSCNLSKCNLEVDVTGQNVVKITARSAIYVGQPLVIHENAPDDVLALRLCLACLLRLKNVENPQSAHLSIINNAIGVVTKEYTTSMLQSALDQLPPDLLPVRKLINSVIKLVNGDPIQCMSSSEEPTFPDYHFQFSVWHDVFALTKLKEEPSEFLFAENYRQNLQSWFETRDGTAKIVTRAGDITRMAYGNGSEYVRTVERNYQPIVPAKRKNDEVLVSKNPTKRRTTQHNNSDDVTMSERVDMRDTIGADCIGNEDYWGFLGLQ
jgi:hypothetical protein